MGLPSWISEPQIENIENDEKTKEEKEPTCYANNNQVELSGELYRVVTVTEDFLKPLGPHGGHLLLSDHPLLPVNNAGSDVVHQLEDDQATAQIRVEIVDVWPHSQRIHPVTEHLSIQTMKHET